MSAAEGGFPATSMPDPDWWNTLWPRPDQVLETLSLDKAAEVVDLCCSDGLFTIPLARMVRHITAIDLDPEMLSAASNRAVAEGITNCTFVVGDAYDLVELVPDLADAVLLANTFHGVPEQTRLARAVAAILRPSGRFIVINWHLQPREQTTVLGKPRGPRTEMRMAPDDVAAVVIPSGLRLVHIIELPPYHYAAIFERPSD